ncbi:MAG: hypothetical protein ACQETE_11100 [Bacteroidota bacterium]
MDQSHLDDKYFVDTYIYNCPYCNRRHVTYGIEDKTFFDWNSNKTCYLYTVVCMSCGNKSLHLSYQDIPLKYFKTYQTVKLNKFDIDIEEKELDEYFFYSVPTSLFSIDSRIPRVLRELFTEAEGCLKSNYLTGASACVRKLIYELAQLEDAEGENYDERIKSLKEIKSEVEPTYFDTLLTIQQVTSDKVHENAYDGWKPKHLKLILSTITEILQEIYVLPEVKKEKRNTILELKQEVFGKNEEE